MKSENLTLSEIRRLGNEILELIDEVNEIDLRIMKNLEHQLQVACVKWFRLQYPDKLLFAIPNGGNRNAVTGKMLKDEGALAGIPDLFLAHGNKSFHGLFIEMKYGKNKPDEIQRHRITQLNNAGYFVAVCYTFEVFVKIVNEYLEF